jgi:hypothetical protein
MWVTPKHAVGCTVAAHYDCSTPHRERISDYECTFFILVRDKTGLLVCFKGKDLSEMRCF